MQVGNNWGGNYSRFTFDEAKRYFYMMKEQGVPVLDEEFNLLQEIQITFLRRFIQDTFGDGSPNQCFNIVGTGAANDFTITGGDGTQDGAGHFYINGYLITLTSDTAYSTQDISQPVLTTPARNRIDRVYLDVYLDEIDAIDDADIIDPVLGTETSRRLQLKYSVKVAEGIVTPAPYTDANGMSHSTFELATISRTATASIEADMIVNHETRGRLQSLLTGTPGVAVDNQSAILGPNRNIDYLDISGRESKLSNQFSEYRFYVEDSAADTEWKTIANIRLAAATYSAASFRVEISDYNSNFGGSALPVKHKYNVSMVRSRAVIDDTDNATITGTSADYCRVLKVATGEYELQVRYPANQASCSIYCQCTSANHQVIVYFNDPATTTAIGTVYTPTRDAIELIGNVYGDNGLAVLKPESVTDAVNEWTMDNAVSGRGPVLRPSGNDADIPANIRSEGDGGISIIAPGAGDVDIVSVGGSVNINGNRLSSLVGSAVAVGDVSVLEVTGLDSDYRGAYIVECFITQARAPSFVNLRFNRDTRIANYDYRRSYLNGAGESYGGSPNANLGWLSSTNAFIRAEFMGNATAGVVLGEMQLSTYTTNTQMFQYAWAYKVSGVMTTIGFASSNPNGIGHGSVLRIYKRDVLS